MSLTFYSDKPVNIKQLIGAGVKCGTLIGKHQLYPNTYTMLWDVGDYEHYATEVLTDPEIQKAFRERVKPRGGDFVIERNFTLHPNGQLVYTVFSNADDMGICHRIFDVLGIELVCEYELEQRSLDDTICRDEMSQEEVVESIDYEYIEILLNKKWKLTESEEMNIMGCFDLNGPFADYVFEGGDYHLALRSDMTQIEVALSVEVEHCVDDIDNDTGVQS